MKLVKSKKVIKASILALLISGSIFSSSSFAAPIYKFDAKTGTIKSYNDNGEKTEHVVVPETIDGVPVKIIASEAFRGDHYNFNKEKNHWIKSIKLPSTVVEIGEHAFSNLKSLETITGLENVEKMGRWAFDRDFSLIFPIKDSHKLEVLK